MKNKNAGLWLFISLVLVLLGCSMAFIPEPQKGEMFASWFALIMALIGLAVGILGAYCFIMACIIGWKKLKERTSNKSVPPIILWLATALLVVSIATSSATGNILVEPLSNSGHAVLQESVDLQMTATSAVTQFKLFSTPGTENEEFEMTSLDGKSKISMPRANTSLDSTDMVLNTPAGAFKVRLSSSGADNVLLEGSDGTIYRPNFALICYIVAGVIVAGGLGYLGWRVYVCGTRVFSNYVQGVSNNLESNSIVFAKTKNMVALPNLTDIDVTSCHHFIGPPPVSPLQISWGTMTVSNMNNNTYTNPVPAGSTDVFGNSVSAAYLWVINETNIYAVTTNGTAIPCVLEGSVDLYDWSPVRQVVLGWLGMNSNGVIASVTTVTMTSHLEPYATNAIRVSGSQILESYSNDRPPWPTTGPTGYVRLRPVTQ